MSRIMEKLASIRVLDLALASIVIVIFCCAIITTAGLYMVYNLALTSVQENRAQTQIVQQSQADIASIVQSLDNEWKIHDKQMRLQLKAMRIPEINRSLLSAQQEIIDSISHTQEGILVNTQKLTDNYNQSAESYRLLQQQTVERQKMQESVLRNISEVKGLWKSCMDCHHPSGTGKRIK